MFNEYIFLFITLGFGILAVLFLIQTLLHKRYAWVLFISIIFGFLAGIVAISNALFFDNPFFESLHLNLYGIHFFCIYLFFERLNSRKPNLIRLSVMASLLTMLAIGLWLVYFSQNVSTTIGLFSLEEEMNPFTEISWVIADFAYWTPAFIAYLGLGVPIYIRTYLTTKETQPLILSIALVFVGFGFFISFLNDLMFILNVYNIITGSPSFIGVLASLNNAFQFIGILLFVITYIINVDYIYRLPNDTYILMVLKKGGIPIHTVHLETRKNIDVKAFLLSGVITAINNLFMELTKRSTPIHTIISEDINVLIQSGKQITAVIMAENISYFLEKALKRYVKAFEKEFEDELNRKAENIQIFKRALNLLTSIFPFFMVKKNEHT